DESISLLEAQRAELTEQLENLHEQIRDQRRQVKQLHDQLHAHRSELHSVNGKITSLEMLQQHAMGKDNKNLSAWLEAEGIADNQRLAEFLDVHSGWEKAVECVLGSYLEAICLSSAEQIIPGLQRLQDESVTLLETSIPQGTGAGSGTALLLQKVSAPWDLSSLLSGVYCAESISEARQLCTQLKAHESVITSDGTWFGPDWLKIIRAKDSKAGVLQREKELRVLKQRQEELQVAISAFEEQLEQTESELKNAEVSRESLQQQNNVLGAEFSSKSAQFSAQSARLEQQQRRLDQVCNDIEDIYRESTENIELIAEYRLLQQDAEENLLALEVTRQNLETLNQDLQSQQQVSEHSVTEARQQVYGLRAKIDALKTSETSTGKQIERLHVQQQQSLERIAELQSKLQQTLTPLGDEKKLLLELQESKAQLEANLKTQRQLQDYLETEINQTAEQHTRVQRGLEKQKEVLDQLRFELQESKVRQQTVNEQLKEIDADAEQVLQSLPEQAEEGRWKKTVDDLTGQIERLGTINLTAIEEYQSQSERLNFLNDQHADLIAALNTLDQAISQIDKESRLRFKETFDKINTGLQEKFPKLFGGGQAYLELTEQDLLESGVNIIARPPGKRNSSIHLLSGGEKALTAVALVFSIFELNPAPFCLLDEVDAPLDDANVGRFSKMVEEMSASVQFLYISHNKATMEIAKQLAGVTMKEPGVSRMVAVDIEEAVSLAEN
ncbi:MAG: chromosome segregation protein SMC, partial [Methylococcales bacterium]